MRLPPLILASSSPRRRELFRELEFRFKVFASTVDELHSDSLTATEHCRINATRKARAVAQQHPNALIIGADTLVTVDNRLFGKPANQTEAETMLRRLQGRTHQVVTAVCLHHTRQRRERTFTELTEVTFRSLTLKEIRAYLELVDPLDKAGAYAIQEHGELIVERIEGSRSNVIGLPLERLREELSAWGSV